LKIKEASSSFFKCDGEGDAQGKRTKKTFLYWGSARMQPGAQRTKVFCFFFSKKKALSSFLTMLKQTRIPA
jgi:hypothetical protein